MVQSHAALHHLILTCLLAQKQEEFINQESQPLPIEKVYSHSLIHITFTVSPTPWNYALSSFPTQKVTEKIYSLPLYMVLKFEPDVK